MTSRRSARRLQEERINAEEDERGRPEAASPVKHKAKPNRRTGPSSG